MKSDSAVSVGYDREEALRSRLNAFMQTRLHLPAQDYYSQLDQQALAELKSVLSDINNIFTLKVTLAFAEWLSKRLTVDQVVRDEIKQTILRARPNANGYDVEISTPFHVIAEVKCNVPINRGAVYGSAQREGIEKDVGSLINGKTKSKMRPDACLKILVLLETPEIRKATEDLVKNLRQYRDRIVFADSETKLERRDQVYVVYVNFGA